MKTKNDVVICDRCQIPHTLDVTKHGRCALCWTYAEAIVPELLDALKHISAYSEYEIDGKYGCTGQYIKSLIAKAEGKS